MQRSLRVLGMAAAALVAAVGSGCTPDNKVPSGPPQVAEVQALDPAAGGFVPIVTDSVVFPMSPIVVIFDRLLDASALVEVDGGFIAKTGVATMDTSVAGSLEAATDYTHNGHHKFALFLPKGPSLALALANGMPAGSTVTVLLDGDKVRSHDQSIAFDVPPGLDGGAWGPGQGSGTLKHVITFQTQPPMATVQTPGDTGPMDTVVKVSFNFLAADAAMHIQVTGSAAGAGGLPLAGVAIVQDEMDPLTWNVQPPPTGWQPGATITVAVDATVTDPYGTALGTPVMGSFMVTP
jgi:hypothetical protein